MDIRYFFFFFSFFFFFYFFSVCSIIPSICGLLYYILSEYTTPADIHGASAVSVYGGFQSSFLHLIKQPHVSLRFFLATRQSSCATFPLPRRFGVRYFHIVRYCPILSDLSEAALGSVCRWRWRIRPESGRNLVFSPVISVRLDSGASIQQSSFSDYNEKKQKKLESCA